MGSAFPPSPRLDYAPYWCEENVHRLLARGEPRGARAWALVVGGRGGHVAVLGQRAGRHGDGLVLWDYHVIALLAPEEGPILALDLDTVLGFPLPARDWLRLSFPPGAGGAAEPWFRLVPAEAWLADFATDRSHMRAADGSWLAPPPTWEPPGRGRRSVLLEWVDPEGPGPGLVLDLAGLAALLDAPGGPP